MKKYNHKIVEKKWQKFWAEKKLYHADDNSTKEKYYVLVEFPYPSGEGLHVGHVRGYTAMDAIARKRRAEGYNVLYPMGWDAFGLPTENYAIKTGQSPAVITRKNVSRYRKQLENLGFSFDWSREVNTTDPNYYKWTQWLFLQFFKSGLAYKAKMPINWCPSCKIGLANEEAVEERCERCGGQVEIREKEQWLLAITKYADRLDRDLDLVDYPKSVKLQQRNWIGRKKGVVINFPIFNNQVSDKDQLTIFTTRAETIFGATFVARPGKADRFTGEYAVNPVNQEKIPIWEAEYVLKGVGTGAVMGVPAHDERDLEFAKKHNLPIREVINGNALINSGEFSGQNFLAAREEIMKSLGAKPITTYKLRDWVFSRQRYWGEPIPLIWCAKCAKWQAVPEKDLPVKLPVVKQYQPTDSGESPLAGMEKWVKTKCPICGGTGRRETDTMPNWAGSSWYYLAYCISENLKSQLPISKQVQSSKIQNKLAYWSPVDWYNGGMEQTTLHLLYSRFWHKFLYDRQLVPGQEPYTKRTSHGLILAAGGEKMSKSKGNVINPDELVIRFGADTLRVYEMFMGPFDQAVGWNEDGIIGARRFLERVWHLVQDGEFEERAKPAPDLALLLDQTVKKVAEDIEQMAFNTAISALMILLNKLEKATSLPVKTGKTFLKLLSPFAPHLTEELWCELGEKQSIHSVPWPKAKNLKAEKVNLVVQVNGRARDVFEAEIDLDEEAVKKLALARGKVQSFVAGKKISKVILVPNRLINIVVVL